MTGEHAWWGKHGRGGCAWQGGMHVRGGHAWHTHTPHQQILQDTVNERVVCILLECIHVHNFFFGFRLCIFLIDLKEK